jgi:glycerol uptake facilitator protein
VTQAKNSLGRMCLAESAGTYLLVLLGCGVVHASVLTGAQSGLWQVAIVWGIAIMLAVYTFGATSGAHINPAITLAFAVWRRFPWRFVVPYVMAQLIGAFLAAATLFVLFNPYLRARELEKEVVRGSPGSEITAMCYGEFFPSPGPLSNAAGRYSVDAHERLNLLVSERAACLAEFLGTLVLAVVVFAVTDDGNSGAPPSGFAPIVIGLTVAVLISVIAPLTQACFNPARDFGPRLFAFFAGWGAIALPGPRGIGFVSVYIVAPLAGAVVGSGLYTKVLKTSNAFDDDSDERSREGC